MVTFDATLPGSSVETWESDGRFAALPSLDLSGVPEVLVIAAHPDDETLGAGGLITESARRGIRVHVVIVTDGAASHPDSPTTTATQLAAVRSDEARAALDVLAPGAQLTLLGFPDGQTDVHRPAITRALRAIIDESDERALVVAPWRGDGHRDHRIVGEICAEFSGARQFVEYPVWMWHWAEPSDIAWPELVSLPIDVARKRAAIAAYPSQVAPLSAAPGDEAMLTGDFLAHFDRATEVFFVSRPLAGSYFDALYAKRDDPWRLATRWYEERKRSMTMAALPTRRFTNALEIGCSIGMLSQLLGERCDRLLATDISPAAVESARGRVGDSVEVRLADATAHFPEGSFDLIVLSEVGYYFGTAGLDTVLDGIAAALSDGGTFVACHWRHPVADYPLSGDAVHAAISARLPFTRIVRHEEKDFLLDVYSNDPRSVAEREGLA